MGTHWSQVRPPAPTLTEKNVPDQNGRVFIVTGGYSGIGLALAKQLYHTRAKVYIAGRSEEKATAAIKEIKEQANKSEGTGQLDFLFLDLSDLSTIKASAEEFKAKETRLDVLWNNAAVGGPPTGSRTPQGLDMQMGTNAVGPYLFTELLNPLLSETAKTSPPGATRVVWAGSMIIESSSAPKGGIDLAHLTNIPDGRLLNYAYSKVANVFLCAEMAKRSVAREDRVLHVVQNPGNLNTNIVRHLPAILRWMVLPLVYDAKFGGYTELWSGLSDELTLKDQGQYIMPWGRKHPSLRKDILDACKSEEEGGPGTSEKYVNWCDEQIKSFR